MISACQPVSQSGYIRQTTGQKPGVGNIINVPCAQAYPKFVIEKTDVDVPAEAVLVD